MINKLLLISSFLLFFACKNQKIQTDILLKKENISNKDVQSYLITLQPTKDSLLEEFYEEVIFSSSKKRLNSFRLFKNSVKKEVYFDSLLTFCSGYNANLTTDKNIQERIYQIFSKSLVYKFSYKNQVLWAVTGQFTCDMRKCNELYLYKSNKKGKISLLGFADSINSIDSVYYTENKLPNLFYRESWRGNKKEIYWERIGKFKIRNLNN